MKVTAHLACSQQKFWEDSLAELLVERLGNPAQAKAAAALISMVLSPLLNQATQKPLFDAVDRAVERHIKIDFKEVIDFKSAIKRELKNESIEKENNEAIIYNLYPDKINKIKHAFAGLREVARYLTNGVFISNDKAQISGSLGAQFTAFLTAHDVDEATGVKMGILLDDFAIAERQELLAIDAVKELREQVHGSKITKKNAFSSKNGVDALSFLENEYGQEIRAGRLGPGQLQILDKNLYTAVSIALGDKTVGHYFDELRGPGREGSAVSRRSKAAASILDTNELEAAKFFSALRPSRLKEPAPELRSEMIVRRFGQGVTR